MQVNKELLKAFQQQLFTGNLRSVYLNAFQNRKQQILIQQLNRINPSFVDQFLHLLFEKESFTFEINQERVGYHALVKEEQKEVDRINQQIDHIYYSQYDYKQETDVDSFRFGFPILCYRTKEDKLLKAPLFIWDLSIEKSKQKHLSWKISKREEDQAYINPLLVSYLKAVLEIDISNELEASLTKETFIQECIRVLQALNLSATPFENAFIHKGLESVNEVFDVDALKVLKSGKPTIVWQGLLGVYKTSQSSILNDYEHLLKEDPEELVLKPMSRSLNNFTALPLNPSQEEILNALHEEGDLLIQGPPGTGKSHTLSAIISNALLNDETCLVVSEKHTALQVIYEQLKAIGLDDYCAIVSDVKKDRYKVIDKIRKQIDAVESKKAPEEVVDDNSSKLNLHKTVIKNHHEVLQQKVNGYNWHQALGSYLRLKQANIPLLKIDHFPENWELTIEEALLHFDDFFSNSPLDIIHDETLFSENDIDALQDKLSTFSFDAQNACLEFSYDMEALLKLYQTQQKGRIEKQCERLLNILTGIRDQYEVIQMLEPGLVHFDPNTIAHKFRVFFSGQWKKIEAQLVDIAIQLDLLISETKIHFDLSLTEVFSVRDGYTAMNTLDQWEKQIAQRSIELKGEITNHFDIKEILEELPKQHQLKFESIIATFEALMTEHAPFKIERFSTNNFAILMQELSEREDVFKEIYDRLQYLFPEYISWRKWQSNISKKQALFLSELLQHEKSKWSSISKLSLLNNTIEEFAKSSLLKSSQSHDRILNSNSIFDKNIIKSKINKRIKNELSNFSNTHEYNIKALFNYRKSKNYNKYSLRNIINKELLTYLKFTPITLCSPSVASDLFSGKNYAFDKVIIDEASQIKTSHIYPSILKGKKRIISGDKQQLAPSNYFQLSSDLDEEYSEDETNLLFDNESLIDFMEKKEHNQKQLNFHYRSNHFNLIQFSNHHFYSNNLIFQSNSKHKDSIVFHSVDGHFENGVNKKEIEQIIKILYNIDFKQTLGIACFNIRQRDAILNRINEEVMKDQFFRRQIDTLRQNGMFVKNIENIQGEERDVMIISGTYGKSEEGQFKQNFGPINQKNGYRLLNVLITRAKDKIHYINSIPQEYFGQFEDLLAENKLSGRGLFYAYIDYCSKIKDAEELNQTLLSYSDKPSTPLLSNIVSQLKDELKFDQISYYPTLNGMEADLLIEHNNMKIIIDVDGVKNKGLLESYNWDVEQEKMFKKHGFTYYRLFSINWLSNRKKVFVELKELIS